MSRLLENTALRGKRYRTFWTAIMGTAFSIVLLFFAVQNIDFQDVYYSMASPNIPWLLCGLALYMVHFGMRILRWQAIINPERAIRPRTLVSSMSIGFLVNNLLPIRAGEVARAYVLARQEPIGSVYAFSTIVLERILDLFALLTFFLLTLQAIHLPPWMEPIALLSTSIAVVSFLALGAVGFMRKVWSHWAPPPFWDTVFQGLYLFRDMKYFVSITSSSLAIWAVWCGSLYATLMAVGIHLDILTIFFLTAVINLGLVIPSGPGFIGTFQFLCVSSLNLFGVSRGSALGFSLVFHLLWYVPTTLMGIYFLWKDHLHLGDVLYRPTNKGSSMEKEEENR